MGDALIALGGAFLAAGLLARLGRRAGLPTIPFFMVAGIIFGPSTPGLTLVEEPADLELLAVLGLVLLLFHMGLEFSLGDLITGGRKLLAAGVAKLAINVGAGLALGAAFGWGGAEALVIAGAVGVSSSAIVTKLLVELRRLANPESRLILGLVVVEDIFLAIYLALLQPVLGGAGGAGEAALDVAAAFAFLLVLAAIARWASRLVARLVDADDDELLTVCFVGLAVLTAGFAEEIGVSAAIGAFMAGIMLAESPVAERIQTLVLPLRDAFAAVFFFAFGLTIDPDDAGAVAVPVIIAIVVTLVVSLVAGIVAARMHGFGRRPAANIALTTLGRGEFSLILATLAAAAGLDDRIGPFVALYVLSLAVIGPVLTTRSPSLARFLPVRLFGPPPARPVGSGP